MENPNYASDTEYDNGTALVINGYCADCKNSQRGVLALPSHFKVKLKCLLCGKRMSRLSVEKTTVARAKEKSRRPAK